MIIYVVLAVFKERASGEPHFESDKLHLNYA